MRESYSPKWRATNPLFVHCSCTEAKRNNPLWVFPRRIEATGCGQDMPLRFSTLYRKNKYPSRDFSHTGLGAKQSEARYGVKMPNRPSEYKRGQPRRLLGQTGLHSSGVSRKCVRISFRVWSHFYQPWTISNGDLLIPTWR